MFDRETREENTKLLNIIGALCDKTTQTRSYRSIPIRDLDRQPLIDPVHPLRGLQLVLV